MSALNGAWAEGVARRYALLRGATLVARNQRLPAGELDLILRHWTPPHWGVWVFAEVKARRAGLEAALMAVDRRKQSRILRAAAQWLDRQGIDPERARARFDVFALVLDAQKRPQVTWIQGAFEGP